MSDAQDFMFQELDALAKEAVLEGFDAYYDGDLSDEEEPMMIGLSPGSRVEAFIFAQYRTDADITGKWDGVPHRPDDALTYFMQRVRKHIDFYILFNIRR